MFLLVAIGILCWALRLGSALERLLLTLIALPVVVHLLQLPGVALPFGGSWRWLAVALLVLAVGGGLYLTLRRTREGARLAPAQRWDALICAGLFLLAFGAWEFAYRSSFVLPAHDPVMVPILARYLAEGGLPAWHTQTGASAMTYPPGYPSLTAVLFDVFERRDIVWAFKHFNLLVVAAIPLAWAWSFRKLFLPRLQRLWVLALCFYFAFYCVERTLPLTLPFGGKNAQLLCGLLLPLALHLFLQAHHSWARAATASVAMLGLLLIHYSGLYMMFVFIASYLLVHWRQELRLRRLVSYAGTAAVALALFAPVILRVQSQGLQLSSGQWSLATAFQQARAMAFVRDSPIFFIFNDVGMRWPYKQVALFLVVLGVVGAARWARRGERPAELSGAASAAMVLAGAIVGSVLIASGFIPRSGINADYVRWFLFFFQAALFAVGLFAAVLLLQALPSPLPRRLGMAGAALAAVALLVVGRRDYAVVTESVFNQRLAREEIYQVSDVLGRLGRGGPCLLITESHIMGERFGIQRYKPLEYTELVSNCRIVNGTWISLSIEEGRALGGMPSEAVLERLGSEAPVFVLASPEGVADYQARLSGFSLAPTGETVGPLSAWAVRPREPAPVDLPSAQGLTAE